MKAIEKVSLILVFRQRRVREDWPPLNITKSRGM